MDDKQTETSTPNVIVGSPTTAVTAPPITADTSQPQPQTIQDDPASISWTASEFMDHDKSTSWYMGLAAITLVVAAAFYALFRDVITTVVILVVAVAFGSFARRRPRQLQYQLDSSGLTIEAKHFPYATFRSFSVIDEGPFTSIVFLPMKRFGLLITVYLDPKDEERIVDTIGDHLPFEPRDPDVIDKFMSRIRF